MIAHIAFKIAESFKIIYFLTAIDRWMKWFVFQYGGKMVPPGTTVVYPLEIREIVRDRFPDEKAGQHDAQYDTMKKVSF